MQKGYLSLETPPNGAEAVRIRWGPERPSQDSTRLRYAAVFDDIDAAAMHFHEGLRRRLQDLERRVYAVDIRQAIAVAESIELSHRRIYCDPALADDSALNGEVARLHRRHARWNRFLNAVGIGAVVLLLVLTFLPL